MNIKKIKKPDPSDRIRKIQQKISQQRLLLRSTISNRPINSITVVSLVPFFIGFLDFINQNQELKKTLFTKNLPALERPTQSVNWDTFEYFTKNSKDFLLGLEKIEWSNDSLFLTQNPQKEVKYPEVFIASFKKSSTLSAASVKTGDEFSRWESFPFYYLTKNPNQVLPKRTPHFSDVLQTFYFNLDEIPLKLEKNKFFSQPSEFVQSEKLSSIENELFNESTLSLEGLEGLEGPEGQQSQEIQEIQQIKEGPEGQQSQEIQEIQQIKKGQKGQEGQEGEKGQEGQEVDQDTSTKQSHKLFFNPKLWKKTTKLFDGAEIQKQAVLVSLSLTKEQQVESDLMKNLVNFDKKKMLSGLNQPHFDQFVNASEIQTNYHEYSLKKGLNKLKLSGFEFVFEIELEEEMEQFLFLSEVEELKEDIDEVFVDEFFCDRQMSGYFYPDMNSKQVTRYLLQNFFSCFGSQKVLKINLPGNSPFLSFLNPKLYQTQPQLGLFSFHKNETQVSVWKDLPIFFKFKNAVDFTSKLDYFSSPQNITQSSALSLADVNTDSLANVNIDYGELEFFNAMPVRYQKVASLFNKPAMFQKTFSQSWEGFSFQSWLIISQLGFAFLVFQFLKSLLTEYFTELLWFVLEFLVTVSIIDENLKEEINILTGKSDKGFRIIPKTQKKFQDIAGLKTLLPDIVEMVWFLKNSGKEFSLSKNFPRGMLLIGPPGTGKTLLVQALAGEAEVPLLTLSGSSLLTPGESGALKLEFLFREARELAPCIVFIDEIDTLAQKRQGVMQNPMGGDEILSVLEPGYVSQIKKSTPSFFTDEFFVSKNSITDHISTFSDFDDSVNLLFSETSSRESKHQLHAQAQEKSQDEQLSLLVQLLIELDGIQARKGVIVIGATNRPEVLDSALLRPGRFDKILQLGLPNYEKRVEIFQLYGQIIGYDKTLSWDYLARRTIGFTAADLASIMNQSSLKAILESTKTDKKPYHTLATIEHGIDIITTYEIEKPSTEVSPFYAQRMAYYQAGKMLLSTILEFHPPTLVSSLWPRRQNRRGLQIFTNLQNYFFQFARRCELEDRIVGCYGGKAAEILFVEKSSVNVSTFGLEDLNFAFVLICFVIEKWYLYSKSSIISQLTQILPNINSFELLPEKNQVFQELADSLESSPDLSAAQETDVPNHPISQNFLSSIWWQIHILHEFEFLQHRFSEWYRLYLPNPEETKRNIDWKVPDDFYHTNLAKKSVNKETSVIWNDLYKMNRDYQVQALVAQSFNQALVLVDENREFLDKLVFQLLQTEVLRESDIEKITSSFQSVIHKPTKKFTDTSHLNIKIVTNSFGPFSRRKTKNWIDFQDFCNS